MLTIGVLICVVFVLLIQVIVHDLQRVPDPPLLNNDSNGSLSNLISDSLLSSWFLDPPKSADWRVPPKAADWRVTYNQQAESSFVKLSGINIEEKFVDMKIRGFSNATKEEFIKLLFSPPSVHVEPDWPVVLGTFENFDNDNWENYLTQIGAPYLMRLIIGSISETVTISRIFEDRKTESKGIDSSSLTNKLGTTSDDFEIHIVTSFWPISYDTQFHQGETILERDFDGSDSLNTFFFATPRLFIQHKIKDRWKIIVISHFDEKGKNVTMIDRERMAMAIRYFKKVD